MGNSYLTGDIHFSFSFNRLPPLNHPGNYAIILLRGETMGKYKNRNITIPEEPASGPSFFWIVVMFGVFWPVGLFMLFQRMRREWTRKRYRDFRRYACILGFPPV